MAGCRQHFVPVTEGKNEVCSDVVTSSTAGGTCCQVGMSFPSALGSGTVRAYQLLGVLVNV